MVEFGTSSAFRGWVRVRVLGYGFGVRGRKVKSRDCALASDLVRAGALRTEQELRKHEHLVGLLSLHNYSDHNGQSPAECRALRAAGRRQRA